MESVPDTTTILKEAATMNRPSDFIWLRNEL